jgi:hypothetical protein
VKSRANAGLYVLLIVFATISMGYYIAGAVALREQFFHADRYAGAPFDLRDDGQTLSGLSKEAKAAGLSDGDFSWQSTEYHSPAKLSSTTSGCISSRARRSAFPSAHRPGRCERCRFVWPPAKAPTGLWAATLHFSPRFSVFPCSGSLSDTG